MAQFSYDLKIPKERIAVLIGKKGEVKEQIESATKTKIKIDSEEGDVQVRGTDALGLFSTREIIKAIGRGFNPEVAMQLLKPDACFELISLTDYSKKDKIARIKGRIIGTSGKARRHIEELTETYICVFGKTVGIIGTTEYVLLAKRAIESLLAGSTHSSVYNWLEKKRRELKMRELEGFDKDFKKSE